MSISWYQGGIELDTSDNNTKYGAKVNDLNVVLYESVLSVFSVTKDDYAQYQCVAKNELGQDSRTISLEGTSKSKTRLIQGPFIINTTD